MNFSATLSVLTAVGFPSDGAVDQLATTSGQERATHATSSAAACLRFGVFEVPGAGGAWLKLTMPAAGALHAALVICYLASHRMSS